MEQLILRAKVGDHDATLEILRRLQGGINWAMRRSWNVPGIQDVHDRKQEARKTLLEAIQLYDPTKARSDSTGATYFLQFLKGGQVLITRRALNLSEAESRDYLSVRAVETCLRQQLSREPTNEEIAEAASRYASRTIPVATVSALRRPPVLQVLNDYYAEDDESPAGYVPEESMTPERILIDKKDFWTRVLRALGNSLHAKFWLGLHVLYEQTETKLSWEEVVKLLLTPRAPQCDLLWEELRQHVSFPDTMPPTWVEFYRDIVAQYSGKLTVNALKRLYSRGLHRLRELGKAEGI
jgi:DNA-directed RNA polymerase specialized sigma subunit